MNERMEQEINRTIALLQASMPQRKSEAALSQLLNIAKSEMNPLLLLALFFDSMRRVYVKGHRFSNGNNILYQPAAHADPVSPVCALLQ